MALSGSLDDYSPAGALRVLSSDGRTGAVRFTGRGGCTVYLCEGQREADSLPKRSAVREADPQDRPAEEETGDPNAAWLENLYAQFIDDTVVTGGKTKKKEALDVAFQADEQAETEKVGTLRRLVDALRRV